MERLVGLCFSVLAMLHSIIMKTFLQFAICLFHDSVIRNIIYVLNLVKRTLIP